MAIAPESGSEPKGFAGFDSLVSNVDKDIADAQRASSQSATSEARPIAAPAAGRATPTGVATRESTWQQRGSRLASRLGNGWWWAVGIVVFLIWISSNDGSNKSVVPAGSSTSPAPSTADLPPLPPGATLDAAPASLPPLPPGFTLDAPTSATSKRAGETPGSEWYEEKPSPGVEHVLSYPQLRYCVAEDIRINAMKPMINEYETVEVADFNRYVSDFNSRCGSFKYRNGSLESVRTQCRRSQDVDRGGGPPAGAKLAIPEPGPSVATGSSSGRGLSGPAAGSKTIAAPLRQAPGLNSGARGEGSVTALSNDERASLEAACSSDKYLNGPAAYKDCVAKQMNELERAPRNPDLSGLTADERTSTEAACSSDKYLNGPAAYNRCIAVQVSSLSSTRQTVDLSWLSKDERASLDAACSSDKYSEWSCGAQ